MIKDHIDVLIESHIEPEGYLTDEDLEGIIDTVNHTLIKNSKIKLEDVKGLKEDDVFNLISERVIDDYENKISIVPEEIAHDFERHISLKVIDEAWVKHISSMEQLREGIGLRGYAQTNPLQAYAMEGYQIFERMEDSIDEQIANFLLHMQITQNNNSKTNKVEKTNDTKEPLKKSPKKNDKKVGRNDKCPCGSGKKYKNCCGK